MFYWVIGFCIFSSSFFAIIDGDNCNITKERNQIANGLKKFYLTTFNESDSKELFWTIQRMEDYVRLPNSSGEGLMPDSIKYTIFTSNMNEGWKNYTSSINQISGILGEAFASVNATLWKIIGNAISPFFNNAKKSLTDYFNATKEVQNCFIDAALSQFFVKKYAQAINTAFKISVGNDTHFIYFEELSQIMPFLEL